jgi:hypothetical protein
MPLRFFVMNLLSIWYLDDDGGGGGGGGDCANRKWI